MKLLLERRFKGDAYTIGTLYVNCLLYTSDAADE